MGRDNNHAGIHLIPHNYRTKYDSVEKFDRYACIIAEANKTKSYNNILAAVISMNNVVLWSKRGQEQRCICGTILEFSEKVELVYTKMPLKSIIMTGKVCNKCKKNFVVRSDLLKVITHDESNMDKNSD